MSAVAKAKLLLVCSAADSEKRLQAELHEAQAQRAEAGSTAAEAVEAAAKAARNAADAQQSAGEAAARAAAEAEKCVLPRISLLHDFSDTAFKHVAGIGQQHGSRLAVRARGHGPARHNANACMQNVAH